MAEKASQRGAVDLGVILMVLAFAVIAGFMFWLNGQAAQERIVEIIEEPPEEVVDEFASATIVLPTDLQPDASALEDQLIRIQGIDVASTLGEQGFWLDFPQGPFLVSLSESLLADSVQVSAESTVTVTGTLLAMSDSVVASWVESGRISEGDGLAAGFASHFVSAERVEGN